MGYTSFFKYSLMMLIHLSKTNIVLRKYTEVVLFANKEDTLEVSAEK
jgi:hypothetical protein